jgi:hypothetical protein
VTYYLSGAYIEGEPFMASYGGQGNRVPLAKIVWAADNGCFARPDKYTDEGYLKWLDGRPRNALFACAPDVVGDWPATLERSLPMLEQIRSLGFAAALVLQDGATVESVPWSKCDAVFVGGSTAWKLGPDVPDLVRAARSLRKWAHMGRVNSWVRLRVAAAIGCQSADGNLAAFGPDFWAPKIRDWLGRLTQQPMLGFHV